MLAIITAVTAAIFTALASAERAISLDECRVSAAIARHFGSDCLYLVVGRGSDYEANVLATLKFYSDEGMFAAAVRADSLRKTLRSPGCVRPTYVILSNIGEVKTFFDAMSADFETPRAVWIVFEGPTGKLDFHDFQVPFDCEFFVTRLHSDSVMRLSEIYRASRDSVLRSRDFAEWTRESKWLRVFPEESGWRNLGGISLRMVDVVEGRYTTIARDDGGRMKVGGFNGDVWEVLSSHLNFVRNYTFPVERKWGGRRPDGSWTGLIGSLTRDEADVASSGLMVTPDRSAFIRFTLPHYSSTTRVYVRRPVESASLRALFSPFDAHLWIALIAGVLAASLAGVVAQSLSPGDREHTSLTEEVFLNFGAVFCGQGCGVSRPRSTPGRGIRAVANFLGVIALGGYSGFLMSSLAVVYAPKLPFTSLDDFPSGGRHSLGMIDGTAVHSAFRNAKTGRKRELFERAVNGTPGNLVAGVGEGFARVCERDFAFLDIRESLSPGTRLDCEVVSLPQDSQRFCVAYALRLRSPYARAIDRTVMAMLNGGVLRKIYGDAFVGRPRTPDPEGPRSIGVHTVVPILTVWAAGVVISLALLVLEIFTFNLGLSFVN